LHRSVEGRALHATSQEIGRACRLSSTRWAVEVLVHVGVDIDVGVVFELFCCLIV
jgi:hypothetical protein